jgi:hypothetical protein
MDKTYPTPPCACAHGFPLLGFACNHSSGGRFDAVADAAAGPPPDGPTPCGVRIVCTAALPLSLSRSRMPPPASDSGEVKAAPWTRWTRKNSIRLGGMNRGRGDSIYIHTYIHTYIYIYI